MNKVIKNINGRATINTSFKGSKIVIRPKCSYTTKHNGEAEYLLQTYGFLKDITPKKKYPISEVKKAKGIKIE